MGGRISKQTHIHRIQKIGPVWRCMHIDEKDCRFFVYFKQEYVLVGRKVLCWECGDQFIFSEENLKQDMPTCLSCQTNNIDIDELTNKKAG
jgi:hypothetical protein